MSRERRRRSIFELMHEYMEELERRADEFFESAFAERPRWDVESCSLEPLRSVSVAADEVVITADLPYTKPETVKVEAVSEDLIEIVAEMRGKLRFDDLGIAYRDGEFNCLRCKARIPVPVDTGRMKIHFKRGIIEIHLPRKRGYKIKVE